MERLFSVVRELSSQQTWSAGVEVSRVAEVQEISKPENEDRSFRLILMPGKKVVNVQLSEVNESWQCDCREEDDPCRHIVGALIALRHSQAQPTSRDVSRPEYGRVVYCFTRKGRYLEFQRYLEFGGERIRVEGDLAAALRASEESGKSIAVSDQERSIDHVLSTHLHGILPPKTMGLLVTTLSRFTDVEIDGVSVSVSEEPVRSRIEVSDCEEGFRVVLGFQEDSLETFENGVALSPDGLRPISDTALSADDLRQYSEPGRIFPLKDGSELSSVIIPRLRGRISFNIRSRALPVAIQVPPRIILETIRSEHGERLAVNPRLVYGEPPIAEVHRSGIEYLDREQVPVRDIVREAELLRSLNRDLFLRIGEAKVFSGDEGVKFLKQARHFAFVGEGSAHFSSAGHLRFHLSDENGSSSVTFKTDTGKGVSAESVLDAWSSGRSFVQLNGGGWGEIPLAWLESHRNAVVRLVEASKQGAHKVPSASFLFDLEEVCGSLHENPPRYFEMLLRALQDRSEIEDTQLPPGFTATLRSYQREGVNWLSFLRDNKFGALLADDMGLGKTVQAICAASGRTLVVCPNSVLFSWEEQIKRFRPGLTVARYHGSQRSLLPQVDITLTTYGLLRLDIDALSQSEWNTIILDESQNIKNPESKVAQAAFRLKGDWRVNLSGTPIENSLKDLWSQMNFLNPGLLGERGDLERSSSTDSLLDPEAMAAIRKRVKPFILRRLKRDVATELPPKTEVVLRCELSNDERVLYDALLGVVRREVVEQDSEKGSVISILEGLLRLRQACCHAQLVPGQTMASSSKITLLVSSLLESIGAGHRALVFSQWTSLLDLIEPALGEASLSFLRIDGTTDDRESIVREFQKPNGPDVLLLSLKAGGVGLNLTAADHVYIVDPWWNPAVEDQAADRAYRIGQVNPVLVHRLVATDTVEEKVLALQNKKRDLIKGTLGEGAIGGLSLEEVRALLA